MTTLSRPNAEIYYELEGAENAPLIMFANSLGTDLSVWDTLLPNLPGYRFLRYDKRGHGRSRFDGEFGMQELVDDAAALLDHIGAKKVYFVGLSIGGMIGQGLCAERPDLVKAFVLMASAAKIGTEEFWAERITSIRANGLDGIAEALMPRWFTKDFITKGHAKPWQDMVANCDVEGYANCCNAIAHTDLWDSTARLSLPVLALVGAEDGSTPPDLVRETAESIAGSEFRIIRKAAHIPCVEQPEETASALLEFFEVLK